MVSALTIAAETANQSDDCTGLVCRNLNFLNVLTANLSSKLSSYFLIQHVRTVANKLLGANLHPCASFPTGAKVHMLIINDSQSIRTQVNSYSSRFVLILVNSYSKFWSIRTHLVNSYLCLVSSYSFWSIRTHFGQFVLKLK